MSRQLAAGVRRPAPDLLVGGSPTRVLRLSAGGAAALDAVLAGRPHPGTDALLERLVAAGMLLAEPGAARSDEVTVVVPVRGTSVELRAVLDGVPAGVPVVVVDDGSEPPLDAPGARLVRHQRSRGPGAARNAGVARVRTPLVAFVDAGVTLPQCWLDRLTGHFADERVVAAAPRVVSGEAPGWVGVLEQQLCALDQGPAPAEVRPDGRVPYVPATTLVVRTDALARTGGFDASLNAGEDVDLVWRLAQHGVVRYDPSVVVRHAPRTRLLPALLRRRDYGASAGPLERRHPRRLRHLRLSPAAAAPWAAALVHPLGGPAVVALHVLRAPSRLPALPPSQARRLVAIGQLSSSGAVGRYALRPAWPLTLAAVLLSRRARRVAPLLAAAWVRGSWPRIAHGPAAGLPGRVLLAALEDVFYAAGVWSSALSERRPGILAPRVVRTATTSASARVTRRAGGPPARPSR